MREVLKDSSLNKNEIDEIIFSKYLMKIPKIQYMMIKEFFNKKILCSKQIYTYGAAELARIVSDDKNIIIEKLILLEVTHLFLEINKDDGKMKIIIPRNTEIPWKKQLL